VEHQLGEDFLLTHEIQEIDTNIMDEIKSIFFKCETKKFLILIYF
jgi:hypothetical protein